MPRRPSLAHPLAEPQEGFALVGLVVAIFIILLMLSVAAPTVARSLRRDRELETVHRAQQYDRAIQLFYKKAGTYPGSIEQLEKSNNIRYLRQKYNNPMTGKPDWRLIKVGENKTTVKGFFGKPLTGLATSGLGSASGIASASGTGTPVGTPSTGFGQAGTLGNSSGTPSSPGSQTDATNVASPGPPSTGTGLPGASSSLGSGIGSQSGPGLSGSGAPFLGVGLPGSGEAILVVNEQTTYPEWEFLYDPRIEQLKAKVNLLGGGVASTSATGLGSAGSMTSGTSSTTSPPPATPPSNPAAPPTGP